MHEAEMYRKEEDGSVTCALCSHRCHIKEGRRGICGVRENRRGTLYALTYGKISAEAIDPIEKKPLFHYLPGTTTYSLGGIGCNFRCRHCQNWEISQSDDFSHLAFLKVEDAVARALASGCRSIAWTYNEPTIWHEYTREMAARARAKGLGTVYVTNGYITPEALAEMTPHLEAYRVDIKAFTDDFYRTVCGAHLDPVLASTKQAYEAGMHVETVTLVIPGMNDDPEDIRDLCRWVVRELGPEVPMHFTAFHPDYHMRDTPATPVAVLERCHAIAREEGVQYPYLGNVFSHPAQHTHCHACGALLIERDAFHSRTVGLENGRCTACGETIPGMAGKRG
ncbi:MAG TPA: AmmeMemoRadiSam system radical SAM enzyme [Methanoculleus sp.]|nr:AmmeMemoRadiSam system radical SAM enzyme [Methanoculleus sp.]